LNIEHSIFLRRSREDFPTAKQIERTVIQRLSGFPPPVDDVAYKSSLGSIFCTLNFCGDAWQYNSVHDMDGTVLSVIYNLISG
jgi:hypothetical protein